MIGSVILGILLTVLDGIGASLYAPMVLMPLGIAGSIYSKRLLYDGINENRFQRTIIKMFFGRKSKQKLKENRLEYSRYKELKKAFDILVELTRQELESENVFNIVNETLNKQGKHIVLEEGSNIRQLEFEEYAKNHPEVLEQKYEKSKEEIMEQIEFKLNKLKRQELLP